MDGRNPVDHRAVGCSDRPVPTGVVMFFDDEQGWGAITSPELPAGMDVFVHFGAIETDDDYRTLAAGDPVVFEYEPGPQDGFPFRATSARRR